ncbi:HAMP domain-containing histidine kinase [Patescibacteria group bacterium]|nr:HAMP domain-containing histidine kinase [Patescibacteria group bacterium]
MDSNDALNYEQENLQKTVKITEKLIYFSVIILTIIYNLPFLGTNFHSIALLNTIIGISIIIIIFIWNNIIKIQNLRWRIYIEQLFLTIIIFVEMGLFEGGYSPTILALPIIIIITVMSINNFKQTVIYTILLFIGYTIILIKYFPTGFNQRFAITTEMWSTVYIVLGIYNYLKIYKSMNSEYAEEIKFREQSEKLNIEKNSFAKIIESHLSEPIKIINEQIDNIIKTNKDRIQNNSIQETFNKIQINSNTLKNLSENILQLEGLNIQNIAFNLKKINIVPLMQNIIDAMNIKAKEKNISIKFDVKKAIYINVDIQRMGEILRNIIDNAIKYTGSNGKIIIDIYEKEQKVYIDIKDNGIGIPKKDIPHLFNKFYRASNVASNTNQGYGIGLYLIKQYTEKMNGTISIQSKEGNGSTFTLSFDKYG